MDKLVSQQVDMNNFTKAGVLVPVYRGDDNDITLVIILRGREGVHGNQLALPGGRWEPVDQSIRDTALRETEEEIGLSRNDVVILEELPSVEVPVSNNIIYPFLGKIIRPSFWIKQTEEIDDVIEVKVKDLLAEGCYEVGKIKIDGRVLPGEFPYYKINEHKLWGATFRIIHPLLLRLQNNEWDI